MIAMSKPGVLDFVVVTVCAVALIGVALAEYLTDGSTVMWAIPLIFAVFSLAVFAWAIVNEWRERL